MQGLGNRLPEEVFGVLMRYQFAATWSFAEGPEPRSFWIVIDTDGLSADEAEAVAMDTVIAWFHAERQSAKKSAQGSKGVKGVRRVQNVTWLVPMGSEPVGEESAA